MSSDDDDEFEDAVEEIPAVHASPEPEPNVSARPSRLPLDGSRTVPARPTQPVHDLLQRSTTPQFAAPFPPGVNDTPQEVLSSLARRQRLTNLRCRMNGEFEPGEDGRLSRVRGEFDTESLASDAASLKSWHHTLLAESTYQTVVPWDTQSTRAQSSSSPSSNPFSPCRPSPGSSNAGSPATAAGSHPLSPPPTHPPPPLPATRPAQSADGRCPPPLPPRNPSIRLPNPVAAEVVARLARIEDDEEGEGKRDGGGGGGGGEQPAARMERKRSSGMDHHSPAPLSLPQQQQQQPRSARLASSADSVVSSGGERRKGHNKTNSLDRGLTLAKSLKAGPFPPPGNKSNSLTRQQPEQGEEEERNARADEVIAQLTDELIDESDRLAAAAAAAAAGSVREGGGEMEEEEGERDTSTSSSSASDSGVKVWNGLKIRDAPAARESAVDVRRAEEGGVLPEDAVGETGHEGKEEEFRRVDVAGQSATPANTSTSSGAVAAAVLGASLDPITQDLERRMSMKGHYEQSERGSSDDGRSVRSSSLSVASARWKDVGSKASSLLRGAFSRARTLGSGRGGGGEGLSSRSASSRVDEVDSGSDGDDDANGEEAKSGGGPARPGEPIVRPRNAKRGPFDFEQLREVQDLGGEHTGAVWCVRFSVCGRLMSTAGQDGIIRVWASAHHQKYFSSMRDKYQNSQSGMSVGASAETFEKTMADLEQQFRPPSSSDSSDGLHMHDMSSTSEGGASRGGGGGAGEESEHVFSSKPFAVLKGHTCDVLDVSWSKNYFLLSSGMDRTVKLWHLSRAECLCCFQHVDFVTCVAFLPKDDRYFLSGSLDGKLRLWHIPDKKVAVWNEVGMKFITAISFVKGGKFAVVGTFTGKCFFYTTDQLKYHTVVDVRSTRGRNSKGHKVTGLAVHGDRLLVTSNDSRIRMYDVRDKAMTCKFKGLVNEHSQIRASFSPDGRHIVCGSEDRYIYLWRTVDVPSTLSVRKDRNAQWERVRLHTAPVTVAAFASRPSALVPSERRQNTLDRTATLSGQHSGGGHIIVSADIGGAIKVMVNRPKQTKLGQSTFFKETSTNTAGVRQSLMGGLGGWSQTARMMSVRGLSSDAQKTKEAADAVEEVPAAAETEPVEEGGKTVIRHKETYSMDGLKKLKLDAHPYYVEREWWKTGKRMTFWASWRQLRDVNRRKVVEEHGADRMRLKALKENTVLPQAVRDQAAEQLHNMPKYSRPRLVLNMCQFTGRQRGKIKPYRVSRHLFRKFADHSQLSGVQRAMW